MKMELYLRGNRYRKAKLRSHIGSFGYRLLQVGAAGLLALAAVVYFGNERELARAMYWLAAAGLYCYMLAFWYKRDLEHVPPSKSPASLDDILSPSLLAHLQKRHLHPRGLWLAATKDREGTFITNHLLLPSEQIASMLSENQADAEKIWQSADGLRIEAGVDTIHAGTVVAAIIQQTPAIKDFLQQHKARPEAVIDTFTWLERLLSYSRQPKPSFGGIGRDWATGYTPNIDQFGQNISQSLQIGGGHFHYLGSGDSANLIIHTLGEGNGSVAIVGGPGSGKTSLVYSVAQRLLTGESRQLQYYQIISLNASLILSKDKTQLERLMITLFAEAVQARNIILFLDDARLFFGSGTGAMDISQVLLPILRNRSLKIITAFTPNDFQKLKAANESLASALTTVNLTEPSEKDTMKILEDSALTLENKANVLVSYEAICESYRLSNQYIQDQAYPGKAIKLLEQAVPYAENQVLSAVSLQKAVEASMGIHVGQAEAPEADKLLHLEDKIHERMINQKRAVSVIASALRRGRAGVSNPNRPIGSFLFLGPTGVGKTELARSLAATYYGDERQMIRLDMSEYQQASDVSRLLEDGQDNSQSLLIEIRQQPFSVVLLDEIEKAHPNILNLLLQLLDEGQLTDSNGKTASFKNAIIITTSNAGANDIIEHIVAGKDLAEFERPLIDKLIASGQFKPELINRYDEVVLFRPLNQDELRQVASLMLAGVNKTLQQQNITVQLTDAAFDKIVKEGYDPQFGARPMRRVIQKSVEDAVAVKILDGSAKPGSAITLDVQDLGSNKAD